MELWCPADFPGVTAFASGANPKGTPPIWVARCSSSSSSDDGGKVLWVEFSLMEVGKLQVKWRFSRLVAWDVIPMVFSCLPLLGIPASRGPPPGVTSPGASHRFIHNQTTSPWPKASWKRCDLRQNLKHCIFFYLKVLPIGLIEYACNQDSCSITTNKQYTRDTAVTKIQWIRMLGILLSLPSWKWDFFPPITFLIGKNSPVRHFHWNAQYCNMNEELGRGSRQHCVWPLLFGF